MLGEAQNFMLSEPRFPQICMCSSAQKLPRPCLGVFMEDLSHKHNLLNHWLLVIASTGSPSHFPRHGGGGEGPDVPTLYGVSSTGKHPPALERGHVGHLGKQTPPGTSPPVHTHAGLRCQQEEQAGPRAAKNAPGH